jgi:hypothetical protein
MAPLHQEAGAAQVLVGPLLMGESMPIMVVICLAAVCLGWWSLAMVW